MNIPQSPQSTQHELPVSYEVQVYIVGGTDKEVLAHGFASRQRAWEYLASFVRYTLDAPEWRRIHKVTVGKLTGVKPTQVPVMGAWAFKIWDAQVLQASEKDRGISNVHVAEVVTNELGAGE